MKKYLTELISEYQEVQSMSEEQVMREYDAPKSEIIADYEKEIDWWENKVYNF